MSLFSLLCNLWMTVAAPDVPVVIPESVPVQQESAGKIKNTNGKMTDMSFDELLIQGKYHFTDEAVATVEQDKVLDGLLDIRKDFKDRIQQSTTRF